VRIVFDAFWWDSGPPSLRHVMREIILAWHEMFPDDELTMVTRRRDAAAGRSDVPSDIRVLESRIWPQAFFARSAVRRAAKKTGADAVLAHNFAVQVASATSSIYLHDVLFTTNPEWFTRLERLYFSLMNKWVGSADIVFTSSRSEARRIGEHSDAGYVLPVGLGLSRELIDPAAVDDPDPALTPGGFILTVGRLNVRKNLERTILAALDKGLIWAERPLIVVGPADGKAGDVDERVENAIASGAVVFTGFVTEERLRWLYRNTALFVYLSLGEGYGMPPVEAAYFGAPVITSDLDVFHENLGPLARYVPPTDTSAIGEAMSTALRTPEDDARLRQAGAQLATAHDWAATVAAIRSAMVETQSEVLA
jgi:glycosyltransferase involved in cell wall biosynthesis